MSVGKPHIKRQRNVGALNTLTFVPRRGSRRNHKTFHNKKTGCIKK